MSRSLCLVWGATATNRGSLAMLMTWSEISPDYETFFAIDHEEDNLFEGEGLHPIDLGRGLIAYVNLLIQVVLNRVSFGFLFQANRKVAFLKRIDLFVDLSGFALSEDFSKNSCSYRSLIFLLQGLIAKASAAEYYIFPQAMGPIERPLNKVIFWLIMQLADLVAVRGARSFEFASKYKKDVRGPTSDLVFLNKRFKAKARKKVARNYVLVNPNSRIYQKELKLGKSEYLTALRDTVARLSEKTLVILTPNEIRKHEYDDLDICREIYREFEENSNVELNENVDIEHLLNLCEQCDFCITSRFHIMIFCLLRGSVPLVISWSEKYLDIMEDFGLENLIIDAHLLKDFKFDELDIESFKLKIQERQNAVQRSLTDSIAV